MAEEKYLKRRNLLPEIAQVVVSMQTGTVSPVTRIESGFVLFKLEDARVPTEEDLRRGKWLARNPSASREN